MKKIFALILALLMLLCGCSDEKNPLAESTGEEALIIPDENAPAKMRVTYADERMLDVEIENISENEIIFSTDFRIQILENGKWCELEIIIENAAFTEPAFIVAPGETGTDEIGFAYLYGSLSEGDYRVIKRIGGLNGEKHDFYNVAAEFSIPFAADEEPEAVPEPEVTSEPEETIPEEESVPNPEEESAEEEKKEDSDMKINNNGGFNFISGNSASQNDASSLENTFVLRANGYGIGAEEIMWHLYAANEKTAKTDRPIMVFDSAEKLKSFYMDMEGTYQFGSGDGSAKEKILSYGEEFFAEKSLIVIHIQSGSGSVRYTVTGVDVSGENCNIKINSKIPEVGTADMADWFVLIEQPKTVTENCSNYSLKIS